MARAQPASPQMQPTSPQMPSSPGGTRLEQQLSNMSMNGSPGGQYGGYNSPQSYGGGPPSFPSPGQNNYGGNASPGSPYGAHTPTSPQYGGSASPGFGSPRARSPQKTAPQPKQHVIPDAVINTAARNPEKKPFAYMADMESIQAQREKVRRKYVDILAEYFTT